jgi:hypothetical protein
MLFISSLYQILTGLWKVDCLYHSAKRVSGIVKHGTILGKACIEYGKVKSEVIWPRNVPPAYIEELIKIDPNNYNTSIFSEVKRKEYISSK